MGAREEIIDMLNQSLRLEHAARIQYLSHAQLLKGHDSEPIVARLTEIASDEKEHEEKFREMIGTYLGAEPTMGIAETVSANGTDEILNVNLGKEKDAINLYKQTYRKIVDNKDEFQYEFEKLEHDLRHIILDEEEHVVELKQLLGQ